MSIKIKRNYEDHEEADGYRILIDRLWPRGMSKDKARIDEWDKDIAPSTALRQRFHQQEINFREFSKYYKQELVQSHQKELARIRKLAETRRVTLLYGVKNLEENHAILLMDVLNAK
jgi:uncharacterized protein YeaO (DUF488 family)